nr:serine/threonine-protein kinase [Micromonospora sp. DSM 115978]
MGGVAKTLSGRYRLIEQLGAGGMSVVWRGFDEVLGRQVAVKVLAPRLAADRAFRQRIRIEAQAAARLCHPNITNVYDYGECVQAGGPVPFVVMELVDGESLAARLARCGRLPWLQAVSICAEVAAALAAAHARGVVHRDVTPGNVMLTGNGAKVVDFGISALVGQRDVGPDGQLLGTPAYLAPERLGSGGEVAAPADVYALGLLLYRSLTGRAPWPAEGTTEVLRAHMFQEPAALPPVPGLPDEVVELCARCLSKDPARRPDSGELAKVLAFTVRHPSPSADPVDPAGEAPPVGSGAGTMILPWSVGTDALPVSLRGTNSLGASGGRRGGSARGRLAGRSGSPRALAGRRPVGVAAVGLGLLAMTGAAWAGVTADPAGDGLADVAAAVGSRPASCQVEYALSRDTGRDFAANLSVTNTGPDPVPDWVLTFDLPGDQTLAAPDPDAATDADAETTGAAGVTGVGWSQQGRQVAVRPGEPAALAPGAVVAIDLAGGYRITNALPTAFQLGDLSCRARVTGVPGQAATTGGGGAAVRTATTGARGSTSAGEPRPERAGPRDSKGKPPHPPKRKPATGGR